MPDPEHACLPLICPEMLDLTLSLLPKPWHLKASTEGAYRFLFDSYALLSFGVNVKNWSLRKDISMFSSRRSFAPLAFPYLASKENDEADTHLGRALIATARTSQHDFKAESILQWRGDMRLGIEAARKSLAPSAKRLSNWANVTGSTSQGWAFVKRASAAEEAQDASTAAPILSDFQTIVGLRLRCCMGLAWAWHGQVLKPVFGQRRKPAEVAYMLQQHIVRPQLWVLPCYER